MDAKLSAGEPRVIISRDALLHNAALLRRFIDRKSARHHNGLQSSPASPDRVRLCATIKADAYGHGFPPVVDALCNFAIDEIEAPVVDMLAVASIAEAQRLPANSLPVLILGPVENSYLGRQRDQLELAIHNGWVLTLCNPSAADDIARIAVACSRRTLKRAQVQVLIDTGMTRSGVAPGHLDELLHKITSHASLRLAGLFTHFASAGDPANEFTAQQAARFRAATDPLMDRLGAKVLRHAANSGGLFFHPDTHFNMVRPGLALYGIDPTGKPSLDRPLRPALKWTAPLVDIKEISQGTGVGYDRTWQASRDTRIGLVPVGYADGYLRCLSNAAMMIVGGKPVPVVGAVSMDSTTIDLGSAPNARIGDEVTLLDSDPLSPASVYALANWAGTIPYEILCRIGPRIHRVMAEPEVPMAREITGEDDADDAEEIDAEEF